jgi:GTP-sensing pleiotropic transcriptional regulator CodY
VISTAVHFPTEFGSLCSEFLRRSGDHERTVESIKNQIRKLTQKQDSDFWVISEKGEIIGYFFAEILPTEYGTQVCLVHQVVIRAGSKKHLTEIDCHLEKWASVRGATEMAFFTRRNTTAFLRSLKNGWAVDSVVLKRKI